MNITEKIGKAQTIAAYLAETNFDLEIELAERGLAHLAGDGEFLRVLGERVFVCPDCGDWVMVTDDNRPGEPCAECSDRGGDYE